MVRCACLSSEFGPLITLEVGNAPNSGSNRTYFYSPFNLKSQSLELAFVLLNYDVLKSTLHM